MLYKLSIAVCIAAVSAAAPYGEPPAVGQGYTVYDSSDYEIRSDGLSGGGDRIFEEKGGATPSSHFSSCKSKCEAWNGCCGFNYQYDSGMYAQPGSATDMTGRCVGKKATSTGECPLGTGNNNILTSRYGMAFYKRDGGAVTGQTDQTTTGEDVSNAFGAAVGAATGLATGLLIAVIVIPIVGIILLVVCIVCCCKQCNKQKAVTA